ncbi:MAG: S8 family serine peptidase [Clostridia bacterium]|nr:S8 family serine peptidase [Clostridia bacterium]
MKKFISIILTLAMALSVVTIPTFAEEAPEKVVTDNTILTEPFDVTYEEEVDAGIYPYDEKTVLVKLAKKATSLAATEIASIDYLFSAKDGFWYTANLADGVTPKAAIEVLRTKDGVLLAEYNFIYQTDGEALCDGDGFHEDIHKNPDHHKQWHLDSCGIQKSWKKRKEKNKNPGGDSGVIVAVIDTGVDFDHEDLKNNMWTNDGEVPGDGIDNDGNGYIDDYYGVDIVAKRGNGDDDHGHGTHVAGVIAAANNNVGVVGIAYNTKIMAIKAGQASGYFLQTDVCKAINYARENGADVINMSFGGSASTIAVQDALEEAYTHSVLVAAAGNDGAPNEGLLAIPCYPAAYSFVLGVMAVDDYGVETGFTNYDVKAFNSVEYELYAPGNAITSTIPNDRYATWNGTSMAAPIVSGMAAVLRSEFDDPDMYPTKFIYGQLASTSDRHAECYDPKVHGLHNLPQIANLYDALTKMPKPEVSLSEFTTFDTSDINSKNNGDGTIDAGEVIALGFELRNRWGMSEDTIVTIDALSPADIPNPYVEFSSDGKDFSSKASVNYKSVGTYSTQDCGKIIEDDLWIGWENPFYLKVAKNAPNDTILAINVTVTCKNALDKEDKTTYSSSAGIELVVKNGVVLPQIIDEDMTLTKDNYYIIPNTTVIEEGATVTVTEGTNIQFWTNDATDAYADSYIASLTVKGTLNCVGTEEEPVKIFPSDLMGKYRVEINESGSGKVNFSYTNLTNFFNRSSGGFTVAVNCEFNQNYKDQLYHRYLSSGGQMGTSYDQHYICGDKAINCAFYKLGSTSKYYSTYIYASCENCIFVDSNIEFGSSHTYENCVFYGNNNYWDSIYGATSGMQPYDFRHNCEEITKIVTDEVAGKTYLQVSGYINNSPTNTQNIKIMNKLAEYLGGTLCMIETQEELDFLKKSKLNGALGAVDENGKYVWLNGDPIGDFITISDYSSKMALWIRNTSIVVDSDYYEDGHTYVNYIIELPDSIHVEELSLLKDKVAVDTSVTYQVSPVIYPSTASDHKLLYFSSNEAVATVDEAGIVTPVATGVATIYVFSEDMQISTSMEIEVKDEVKATSIKAPETMQINIDETANLNAVVKPSNATKHTSYSSSDDDVATVNSDGVITAVSKGQTTITTSVSNGDEVITVETVVSVVVPAESIKFEQEMIYIAPDETKEVMPIITPLNATNQNLIWDSSNPEVCYVNENGEIAGVQDGIATLKATIENTDLSAYVTVCVSNDITASAVVDLERYNGAGNNLRYAVTEDGKLWYWGTDHYYDLIIRNPKNLDVTCDGESIDVADFAIVYTNSSSYRKYLIIDKDGNLYESREMNYNYNLYHTYVENYGEEPKAYKDSFTLIKENIKKLVSYSSSYCFAITEDGTAWTMGYNSNGRMGIGGSGQYISTPVSVAIDGENIVDGRADNSYSYLLTDKGNLYMASIDNGNTFEYHTKVCEGVDYIEGEIAVIGDKYIYLHNNVNQTLNYLGKMQGYANGNPYYIEDDKAYIGGAEIPKLTNVVKIMYNSGWYLLTENDELYSASASSLVTPELIPFGVVNIETAPALREGDTNLIEYTYEDGTVTGILTEDTLKLGFDGRIYNSNEYHYITLKGNGDTIAVIKSYDLNDMFFKASGGFKEGVEYVLTIPENSVTNDISLGNEAITVTFTYEPEEIEEEIEEEVQPEVPEAEEEEPGEEVHVHVFETVASMPTFTEDGKITNTCECGVVTETVLPAMTERDENTEEDYNKAYGEFVEKGFNTNVTGSAILNRLIDDDVTKWLRITAPSGEAKYGFGGNYWGTTNSELINHQILDYNDFITLGDINEGEILTEAPENTFPFVTDAYLTDESGEVMTVVSGGKVKFVVKFNRDMDTEYGLNVFFGSTYPYADYEIYGGFQDARTWVGETTLKTVIENGYQFIRVTNGRTAADENGAHLKLYTDWARFGFEIDTTAAMAMMMQGYADNDGIHLEWMQDDYDTLAGYNVYRATSEDGNYVRVNKTVIPSEENTFVDTEVEPGVKYYYTFTVVLTDVSSESKPAGKISITAKDTMAPNVYHSPVYTATTGNKVIVSATVSDNIGIQNAKLYYRVKGTEEWKSLDMTKSNDKYTAAIPASSVTLDGVEYYIAAFDGVNYTYAGSHTSEDPYEITVYQAVENNAKGDVDGDGNITVLDALKLLRAIYDESLLTQEEFLRADINGDGTLAAVEALRILQYANKSITSVLW